MLQIHFVSAGYYKYYTCGFATIQSLIDQAFLTNYHKVNVSFHSNYILTLCSKPVLFTINYYTNLSNVGKSIF